MGIKAHHHGYRPCITIHLSLSPATHLRNSWIYSFYGLMLYPSNGILKSKVGNVILSCLLEKWTHPMRMVSSIESCLLSSELLKGAGWFTCRKPKQTIRGLSVRVNNKSEVDTYLFIGQWRQTFCKFSIIIRRTRVNV